MTPRVASDTGAFSDKQSFPDQIGTLRFRKSPVFAGMDGSGTKELRFEVVVGQKLVNSPKTDLAKARRKQVRVNIDEWSGLQDLGDRTVEFPDANRVHAGQQYSTYCRCSLHYKDRTSDRRARLVSCDHKPTAISNERRNARNRKSSKRKPKRRTPRLRSLRSRIQTSLPKRKRASASLLHDNGSQRTRFPFDQPWLALAG